MIIIRMSGGLGNQMFQYALYRKLRLLGREVSFDDKSQYDAETFKNSAQKRRPKRLDVFGITYETAEPDELTRLTDSSMNPADRIRRKLTGRKSLEKCDRDFMFDPSFLEETEGYFCGGFQSPKYFAGAEEEIRKAFTFPEGLLVPKEGAGRQEKKMLEQTASYAERIEEANREGELRGISRGGSASIHLRFGDYVDKGDIYGGICTDAYYNTAISELKKLDPGMTFFVFSNDEEKAGEWIRYQAERSENLGRGRFVLVKGSDEDHGYLDLYLMTLCRNHIIANSSFSWWGAWLCAAPQKTVFAPSIWNNEKDGSELARTDIYADFMRRISPRGTQMSDLPLVSVIITAYNVADYLGRALESVQRQTWQNLEIIAVDDGSSDATGQILDEYAGKDPRIRVVHTENRGVSAARNEGIAHARGEYIGFVDGDDRICPQMYETMVRGILSSGADMAVVNYREIPDGEESKTTEDGRRRRKAVAAGTPAPEEVQQMQEPESATIDAVLRESVLLQQREALQSFIRAGMEKDERVVLHPAVWSKLFHRRLLRDNRFPEGTSAEDIPFTTKALCLSRRVLYIPAQLYDYVKNRGESIMNSGRAARTLTQEIPAWRTHLALLKESGLEELSEESEYWFYRRMLFYEEDYRRCQETAKEAGELQERILKHRERILELAGDHSFGRRGDRERLRLYANSPRGYFLLSDLYEKTVVAWKNRR